MARSIWTGSLSFGLVNIPVSLNTAEKSDELEFHLLDRRDKAPIHYQRVSSTTGKEVPWDQTVRGYEFEPHRYVVLSDEDFKHANPKSTQSIEILDFVERADIPPIYFDKPYYLAPGRQGAKSYALLHAAMQKSGKAGIAKVVIRTRQHLAAVLPVGNALVLNLLRFADELRDPADLDLPAKPPVAARELKLAQQLIDAMVAKWNPQSYRDDYKVDVKALIDRRIAAGELDAAKTAPPRQRAAATNVVDLMALLKRSVAEGGSAGRKPPAGGSAGSKRSAAGSAARRKPPAGGSAESKHPAGRSAGRKQPTSAGRQQPAGGARRTRRRSA